MKREIKQLYRIDYYINENECFICCDKTLKHYEKGNKYRLILPDQIITPARYIYLKKYPRANASGRIQHSCNNPICINPEHIRMTGIKMKVKGSKKESVCYNCFNLIYLSNKNTAQCCARHLEKVHPEYVNSIISIKKLLSGNGLLVPWCSDFDSAGWHHANLLNEMRQNFLKNKTEETEDKYPKNTLIKKSYLIREDKY
jgi:hypothetical protein